MLTYMKKEYATCAEIKSGMSEHNFRRIVMLAQGNNISVQVLEGMVGTHGA